ncbi:MAG: serine/threonine-protein kinase [Polyangiales bacterium]
MEESESNESAMLQPGALVAERWKLVEKLGTGGFGSVWRATHVTLAHDVAIKFLQVGEVTAAARARFEREARIAARLGEASRHITRVIDYGVFRASIPYLCMELLHGETLSQRLRREKIIPLRAAARMIVQLCRALQVAHTAGVIHRDLKPSNIFLSRTDLEGEVLVKLMDFGIAKSTVEQDGEESTRQGTIVGTPAYMSPEQILSKKLDPRADLWGIAACVYRMVCGRSPFGQGGIAELGLRILATDPLPPSTLVPELPAAFDAWMEKALAKGAEDRFQSARDLGDALATAVAIDAQESAPDGFQTPLPDRLPVVIAESTLSIEISGSRETIEQSTRGERAPIPSLIQRVAARRTRARMALVFASGALGLFAAGIAVARLREPARVDPPSADAPAVKYAAAPPPTSPPTVPPSPIAAESSQPVPAPSAKSTTMIPPKPLAIGQVSAPKAKPAKTLQSEAAHLWIKKDEL